MSKIGNMASAEAVVDKALHEALVKASDGLDLDRLGTAIKDAVEALAKQAEEAKNKDYSEVDAVGLSKAMNNLVKVVDVAARLQSFAKGQPDSRPDYGMDWLKALTLEQLKQVETWLGAAK